MSEQNPSSINRIPSFGLPKRSTIAAEANEAIVYDPFSHELRKELMRDVKDSR
jgi:hypothetical protein